MGGQRADDQPGARPPLNSKRKPPIAIPQTPVNSANRPSPACPAGGGDDGALAVRGRVRGPRWVMLVFVFATSWLACWIAEPSSNAVIEPSCQTRFGQRFRATVIAVRQDGASR